MWAGGDLSLLMASQRRLQSKLLLVYLPLASDGSCFSSFGEFVLVFCEEYFCFSWRFFYSSKYATSSYCLWFVMCAVNACDINMQLQMGKWVSEAMALMKSLGGNFKLLNIIMILQS